MVNTKVKKVLMVHDYPPMEGGGIEVNVFKVSRELLSLGYAIDIATSRFSSETFVSENLKTTEDSIGIHLIESLSHLQKLIDASDIVNIHFTFSFRPASMAALKMCVDLKKPCIFSIQTTHEHLSFSSYFNNTNLEKDMKMDELKRLLMNENVVLSGPSTSIEDTLSKLKINKKLNVIRNGVDAQNSDYKKYSVEESDLLYVGEISFLKGVNYLIDALRELKVKRPNILLRIIGSGSDEIYIKRLVDHYGLGKNVEFTGYVKNGKLSAYFRNTKLYVHPSLTESWGNSVVEALATGVPVIATKTKGVLDLTNNGELATLVPCGDSHALAKEINNSLCEIKSGYMSSKTFQLSKEISSKYTFLNQAMELDALYKSV